MLALNGGLFLFVVHDALSKILLVRYPAFELILMRSLFALPLVLILLQWEQGHLRIRTRRFWALMLRGGLSVAAFGCFLFGLDRMPLGDAFAIFMSAPLLMAALAGPLLGEPATTRQWTAVVVGFAAVLIMIRPGGSIPLDGALVMLVAVVCFALGSLLTRALGRTESAAMMTVFVMGCFILAGALATPFVWVRPAGSDVGLMAMTGVLAAGGMYFTIYAYRCAPPALIAPFQYTAVVWAMLLGFLVWGDVPAPAVMAGAAVVVASGIYVSRGA